MTVFVNVEGVGEVDCARDHIGFYFRLPNGAILREVSSKNGNNLWNLGEVISWERQTGIPEKAVKDPEKVYAKIVEAFLTDEEAIDFYDRKEGHIRYRRARNVLAGMAAPA